MAELGFDTQYHKGSYSQTACLSRLQESEPVESVRTLPSESTVEDMMARTEVVVRAAQDDLLSGGVQGAQRHEIVALRKEGHGYSGGLTL